jgi:hypothetical protein
VTEIDDLACGHSIWLLASHLGSWRRTGRSWRRQAFRTRRIGGLSGPGSRRDDRIPAQWRLGFSIPRAGFPEYPAGVFSDTLQGFRRIRLIHRRPPAREKLLAGICAPINLVLSERYPRWVTAARRTRREERDVAEPFWLADVAAPGGCCEIAMGLTMS